MNGMMGRRQVLKVLAGSAMAVLPATQWVTDASAARTWCKADPLFTIGGSQFDVTVSADSRMLDAAIGPIIIALTIPSGVGFETVLQDDGFGYGFAIATKESPKFKLDDDSIKLSVSVIAPASDSSIPVTVSLGSFDGTSIVDRHTVSGTANQRITWTGEIDGYEWPGGSRAAARKLSR